MNAPIRSAMQLQHKTPSEAKPRSSSTLPSLSTSCGGRYAIRLSGLSIIVIILSSAFIALFSGNLVSFYSTVWQQREVQNTCQSAHTKLTETETMEKMINFEALVHPAMITHLNPTRVAVLGGNQHHTSATLGEILKHASVKDAVVLRSGGAEEHEDDAVDARVKVSTLEMKMKGRDEEFSVGDHEKFDVIIDPNPFKGVTGFSSHFNCLNDGGVVSDSPMIYDILCTISSEMC